MARSFRVRSELRVDVADVAPAHDRDVESVSAETFDEHADVRSVPAPLVDGRPLPLENGRLEAARERDGQRVGRARPRPLTSPGKRPSGHAYPAETATAGVAAPSSSSIAARNART